MTSFWQHLDGKLDWKSKYWTIINVNGEKNWIRGSLTCLSCYRRKPNWIKLEKDWYLNYYPKTLTICFYLWMVQTESNFKLAKNSYPDPIKIQWLWSFFVDVEGTKDVKQLISLLRLPINLYHEIDADPSSSGS